MGHLLRECERCAYLSHEPGGPGHHGRDGLGCSFSLRAGPGISATRRPSAAAALIDYESVQLFVERAQAVAEDVYADPNNAQSVAEVCFQLEGIPLAIELAAARVKAMPVEQIALASSRRTGSAVGWQPHSAVAPTDPAGDTGLVVCHCCVRRSVCCWGGCRSFRRVGLWRRRKRCVPTPTGTGTRFWIY